jgi:uncharacterized zinc-type alcohol dehydrogenase-like protein
MPNTSASTLVHPAAGAHTAHGYAAQSAKSPLAPYTFTRRAPGPRDVAIDIKFSGICHSDIHQARDEWGGSLFPLVPGHEIAGIVTAVGADVTSHKAGDRVGVGCMVNSDRTCPQCARDLEQYCPNVIYTYNSRDVDGSITSGGYSDHIVVDEHFVVRIPDAIPLDRAAPLLCAGITLYSPLRHWDAGPGKKVAIVGLGGLGHMGVKLAHALGAKTTVLSHSPSKRDEAIAMGADHFYATSDRATFKQLRGSFDLIINTVSADIDWNAYLGLLAVDGTMVLVGLPEKPVALSAFPLTNARRSLAGSGIGGMKETQEMLDFCAEHGVMPEIEITPMNKVNDAWERVIRSDVRYRFVIDMATLGER